MRITIYLIDLTDKMRSVPILILIVILIQVSVPQSDCKAVWPDTLLAAEARLSEISSLSACRDSKRSSDAI